MLPSDTRVVIDVLMELSQRLLISAALKLSIRIERRKRTKTLTTYRRSVSPDSSFPLAFAIFEIDSSNNDQIGRTWPCGQLRVALPISLALRVSWIIRSKIRNAPEDSDWPLPCIRRAAKRCSSCLNLEQVTTAAQIKSPPSCC